MHPRLHKALTTAHKALVIREARLEKQGFKMLTAAMNRPRATVRAELEFILLAINLSSTRKASQFLRSLLRSRKPPIR